MIAREGVDIHKVVHCLACTVDIIFGDNHVNDDEDYDYGDYDDDDDDADDCDDDSDVHDDDDEEDSVLAIGQLKLV